LLFCDIALGCVIDQNEMIRLPGEMNDRVRRAVDPTHFGDRIGRKHQFQFIGGTDHQRRSCPL
jgi:hypothetical protein